MKRMLQTLLADRFKLTLHRETKEMPVYSLIVGKEGPKFHESQPASDEGPKPATESAGRLVLQNMAMSDLVFSLVQKGRGSYRRR